MAMTTITAATTLAGATAFTLSGPCRLRADDLTGDKKVTIYEERVDGDYEAVKLSSGNIFVLDYWINSRIFEGYGSYKAVISESGIDVGYDEG